MNIGHEKKKKQKLQDVSAFTHFSSSSFFFMMSLLQAGMDASRASSSSAYQKETKIVWSVSWLKHHFNLFILLQVMGDLL